MRAIIFFLVLVVLLPCAHLCAQEKNNDGRRKVVDFKAIGQKHAASNILNNQASEPLTLLKEIAIAEKDAKISQLQDSVLYTTDVAKYRKSAWDLRICTFRWHFVNSILIFFMVITIVSSGLYFSYLQFKSSNFGKDSGVPLQADFKISKDGIEVSSSVIGLLVLTISLVFFYLYLNNVYPVLDGPQPSIDETKAASVQSAEIQKNTRN